MAKSDRRALGHAEVTLKTVFHSTPTILQMMKRKGKILQMMKRKETILQGIKIKAGFILHFECDQLLEGSGRTLPSAEMNLPSELNLRDLST